MSTSESGEPDPASRSVLVTGGCGYIGSVLVPILLADERVGEVTVLDNLSSGSPHSLLGTLDGSDLAFREGDIRQYGDVESATRGADRVIHLAAITGAASTHDRREETFETNFEGSRNVFNAAEKFDVETVVFASSCNCYGRATTRDIDESTQPDPLNPYAESKLETENLLRGYLKRDAFDGTALRMSTVYGHAPGIRFNLVVNAFVFRALTGRSPTVYGDGSNWRPFIHARDAARAYRDAAIDPGNWPQFIYNVGSNDENYRIDEIAETVRKVVDPSLDVSYLRDRDPGPSYHVNFDRLDETDYDLEYTLREGVRELARGFTDGAVSRPEGERLDTVPDSVDEAETT